MVLLFCLLQYNGSKNSTNPDDYREKIMSILKEQNPSFEKEIADNYDDWVKELGNEGFNQIKDGSK